MTFLQNIFSIKNEIVCGKKYKVITICGIKFQLINKAKILLQNRDINKKLVKYKYVHLMKNDKFNKPFVDFLNKYFDANEHLVLCKRRHKHPFPQGDNVIEVISIEGLDFSHNDKIICHSLFDEERIEYLYNHPDILKNKAYWAIWGGDLYNAVRDEKNDFVRENFKGYLTDFDKDVAIKKYHLEGKPFYCIHAIFPITLDMIKNAIGTVQKKDYIQIQVNNSCDDTILEMLDILSKFKDENIRISTVLSCGKNEYRDEIIAKGKELFGDKFGYIKDYMSPDEYAKSLARNDILILNQNRQQGVGNTVASLTMGKKVYIKSDISSYGNLIEFGTQVFDTKTIADLSFEEFIRNDNTESSKKNALKFFDDEYKASLWRDIFNAK